MTGTEVEDIKVHRFHDKFYDETKPTKIDDLAFPVLLVHACTSRLFGECTGRPSPSRGLLQASFTLSVCVTAAVFSSES